MTLQAWIDDSGSEPSHPVFFLAGFMAQHEKWAQFSDEWQRELDLEPKLAYFKMNQAARLRQQFDRNLGWTEKLRDERVLSFAKIAAEYAQVRVSALIRHDHFKRYMQSHPAVQRRLSTDSPYTVMFTQLILHVAAYSPMLGIHEPCDFIFDEQDGFADEAIAMWPGFKEMVENSEKPEAAKMFGSRPITRDDKSFNPLQAGDLYAWHLRDHWIKSRKKNVALGRVLSLFEPIPKIEKIFTGGEMRRMDRFLKDVRPVGVPLINVGKNRVERKRLRRKAQKNKR